MTENPKTTSVRLSPELKARLAEIKRRSAAIEFTAIGRRAADSGWGYEDVLLAGAEVLEARIAAQWTPEHEALLRSLPPPATLRGSHGPRLSAERADAILAEARERGFGPDAPQEAKFVEAVRLHDQGVPDTRIGELFGVTGGRVNHWITRVTKAQDRGEDALIAEAARLHAAGMNDPEIGARLGVTRQQVAMWRRTAPAFADSGEDKLTRARSRSRGDAPVRHVTPGLEPAAGSVPFLAAEAKPS